MNPASLALADQVSFVRTPVNLPLADLRSRPVAILGVPFDAVSSDDALDRIDAMVASRRAHYVVTANVDFLVQARRDVELRRILVDADLMLCDGTPLLWASRWLGSALPERVAGSDLAPRLLARAAERGHRVYFLGAGPGVAADAAARLRREYQALRIVGHSSPPAASLLEMDHDAMVREIRAASPDILLVSFGCPKQEKWIAMHYRTLGVPVCIGVGATLDFLAGRVRRAPGWMRRSGCEWLFRLWQEPRRLSRRYATDLYSFAPILAVDWWQLDGPGNSDTPAPRVIDATATWRRIDAGMELTRASLERDAVFWRSVAGSATDVLLEVAGVRRVDAAGLAYLIRCRQALQRKARSLVLVGTGGPLRRALARSRIAGFFVLAADRTNALAILRSLDHPPVVVNGDANSIFWCGEVTATNAERVWSETKDLVASAAGAGATVIRIELGRLRFIDSSAARLMQRLKQWAPTVPAEIVFTDARPQVREVLQRARLDRVLLGDAQ